MFDCKLYFTDRNDKILKSYENTLTSIRGIQIENTSTKDPKKYSEFNSYFGKIRDLILSASELEKHLNNEYFSERSFETLSAANKSFFEEIRGSNYDTSYANPKHAVTVFGQEFGGMLASLYLTFRRYISFAFQHRIYKMESYNRVYLDLVELYNSGEMNYSSALSIATRVEKDNNPDDVAIDLKSMFDSGFEFFTDIILNYDLSDLRYLFRYGINITDNEIKTAKFLNQYPDKKIKQLAHLIVHAYLRGFEIEGKDVSGKSTVNIMYAIGQERLIRQVIADLRDVNLTAIVHFPKSTDPNKQVGYDHRFDSALFFNEDYSARTIQNNEKAHMQCKTITSQYSGIIVCEKFGESAFKPEKKDECIQFSPEQQSLYQQHENKHRMLQDKFIPFSQTSFSIVAFPSPEIGDNFESIFEDIMEVNMLNSEKYETIQQKMIDALDQAKFVHIKGKDGNLTDLMVQMQPLVNPKIQTNFNNCGADMNIPVGEVFTSPQLKGTTGVLHIEETFLSGLKYVDLKLTFEDGFIKDYSCKNFENDQDNRNYVHENLIFPNDTLPIGEFAIGTNTLAYVVARKHNIIDIMPILIVEKMGPHFAVGDTCYAWQEDKQVYNLLNNKEIMSRENEKSALRKTDINQAYTNTHTDITLPYDTIGFISVVKPDSKYIDIIKDGRFVLEGTEELNIPLDE